MMGDHLVRSNSFTYIGLEAGAVVFPILCTRLLLFAQRYPLDRDRNELYKSHAYVAIFLYIAFLVWVFTTHVAAIAWLNLMFLWREGGGRDERER